MIRAIKSKWIRWTRDVAHMRRMIHREMRQENLKRRQHLQDIGVDGRMLLKGISKGVITRTGFIRLGIGASGVLL
jgi:hypothetical protein